jgi:hypothetical protein
MKHYTTCLAGPKTIQELSPTKHSLRPYVPTTETGQLNVIFFRCFPQPLRATAATLPSTKPHLLPSAFFPVILFTYHRIIRRHVVMILTASFNKPQKVKFPVGLVN